MVPISQCFLGEPLHNRSSLQIKVHSRFELHKCSWNACMNMSEIK